MVYISISGTELKPLSTLVPMGSPPLVCVVYSSSTPCLIGPRLDLAIASAKAHGIRLIVALYVVVRFIILTLTLTCLVLERTTGEGLLRGVEWS